MSVDPIYRPADFRRVYVDRPRQLAPLVEELGGRDALGVDLEMGQRMQRLPGGLKRWVHIPALIQLASDELSLVIDVARLHDLSPLHPLMAAGTRKVFLGGGQDVALLGRIGLPPANVVDVGEVALALFGRREDGMAALAHRIFGLTLDKTVRRTDWLARPLNPALITYAHRDAELTLMIYRWFQAQYPEVLRAHQRATLEPGLPASTPPWLREAVTRSSQDLTLVLEEFHLEPVRDREKLEPEVAAALDGASAPWQVGRLLRIAGELGLLGLAPQIIPYSHSHSSVTRAAAARGLGGMRGSAEAEAVLEDMKQDPIEEVRKAAEAALRTLRRPEEPPPEQEEASSLDEDAQEALRQLMERLGEGG